jgi:actin-related protein
MSLMNPKFREELIKIRENGCNLVEGDEVFQNFEINMDKIYKFEIGDPLYISTFGYFNPKLFLPFRLKNKSIYDYEDIYTQELADEQTFTASTLIKINKENKEEKEVVKKKKKKENNIGYKKSVVDTIIECMSESELVSMNVLLSGIYYKGFAELLQKSLTLKKNEKVNVLSDPKNKFLSWKGACILSDLESCG